MGEVKELDTLPVIVKEIIRYFLHTISYGNLILNMQDGFVVKAEITEKIMITAKDRDAGLKKPAITTRKHRAEVAIIAEMQKIKYGQIIIRLENGQVTHIEKTEKLRMEELKGVNGEGI